VRKLLVPLGVLAAVGMAVSAFTSTSSASSTKAVTFSITTRNSAPPKSDPTASAEMQAAIRHGGARSSLHYVSTSGGGGITTTIVGDVNKTSGTQTITVKNGKVTATMVIRLIGHEAYFKGAAAAIYVLIGLTTAQSAAAAGRWVSVVPSNSVYNSTAAALTVGSVMSEITLSPPITGTRNLVSAGQRLTEISGAWTGTGITAKDHATAKLDVTRGAKSVPFRFSGVVPATATSSRFVDNLVVTKWGEAVRVAPPVSAVPLSQVLRTTTTTTTTPPVVV
jgi:hypothetical protein